MSKKHKQGYNDIIKEIERTENSINKSVYADNEDKLSLMRCTLRWIKEIALKNIKG